ncbi:MAG: hypothetical protein IJD62_06675, partial [Oscillospiraceae bacterium]|nr:hypothetical protein [Oscillospiraceae bacterium]
MLISDKNIPKKPFLTAFFVAFLSFQYTIFLKGGFFMKKLLSIFLAFLFFCSCGETLPQEPAELPTLEEPVFENEPLIALPPKSLCEFR